MIQVGSIVGWAGDTNHPYYPSKYRVVGVSNRGVYVIDRFGDVLYFLFSEKELTVLVE